MFFAGASTAGASATGAARAAAAMVTVAAALALLLVPGGRPAGAEQGPPGPRGTLGPHNAAGTVHNGGTGEWDAASGLPRGAADPGRQPRGERAEASLVDDYVDALAAESDPDRMREGLELTEDGSAAHDYLRHHATLAQAWADGSAPVRNARVYSIAGAHELCRSQEPADQPVCAIHENFTERQDRLVGLRVDGQDPGAHLSTADDVTDDSEGVRATFLSAYRDVAQDVLVVTVDLTTTDDVSLDLDGAAYGPEGAGGEKAASPAAGRHELDAESGTHAAFYFPGADPGGELRLEGCLARCSDTVELALPVPEPE